MPNVMAVPGMLHISGNLLEDVTNSLSHWRVFWPQLKNFASLITNQQHLNPEQILRQMLGWGAKPGCLGKVAEQEAATIIHRALGRGYSLP